jgi:hypothetical protein
MEDFAESVKDTTAPDWDRLLDEVRAGRIKRCYIDEQSRAMRALKDALHVQSITLVVASASARAATCRRPRQ